MAGGVAWVGDEVISSSPSFPAPETERTVWMIIGDAKRIKRTP